MGRAAAEQAYSFAPVARTDIPLLTEWLRAPELAYWWGDADREAATLVADLDEPRMRMEIVSFGRRPFACAQNYDVHAWPQPHFAHLPRGARAIDSFIGEPHMLGRGHGSAFLKLLSLRLLAEGAPLVAIDPAAENHRARKAIREGRLSHRPRGRRRAGPSGRDGGPRLTADRSRLRLTVGARAVDHTYTNDLGAWHGPVPAPDQPVGGA
jgi:aminoglycoside 6'-N-acetyltransferase